MPKSALTHGAYTPLAVQTQRHYAPPPSSSGMEGESQFGLTQFLGSPARPAVVTGRGGTAGRKRKKGYSKSVSEKKERRREGRKSRGGKSNRGGGGKVGEFVLEVEEEEEEEQRDAKENESRAENNRAMSGSNDGWEDDEAISSPEKGPAKSKFKEEGGMEADDDDAGGEDSDATKSLLDFGGDDNAGLSFGEEDAGGRGIGGEEDEGGEQGGKGGEGGNEEDEDASSDDDSALVQKRLFPSTAKKPTAKKRRVIRETQEDDEEDSVTLEAPAQTQDEAAGKTPKVRGGRRAKRKAESEEEEEEEADGYSSNDEGTEAPPVTQAPERPAGARRSKRLEKSAKEAVRPARYLDASADEDSENEFTVASTVVGEAEAAAPATAKKGGKGGRGKKATREAANANEGKGKDTSTVRRKSKANPPRGSSAKKAPPKPAPVAAKKPASHRNRFVVAAEAQLAAEESSLAASEAAAKAKENPRKKTAEKKKGAAQKKAATEQRKKQRRDELDFEDEESTVMAESDDDASEYEPTQGEGKAKLGPRPTTRRTSSRTRKGKQPEAAAAAEEPTSAPEPRRRKKDASSQKRGRGARGSKDDAPPLAEEAPVEVAAGARKARSSEDGGVTAKAMELEEEPRRRTRSGRAKRAKAEVAVDDGAEEDGGDGRKARRGSAKGRGKSAKALELEDDASREARVGRGKQLQHSDDDASSDGDEAEQPTVDVDFGGDGFEVEYGEEAETYDVERNTLPFTQAPYEHSAGSSDGEEGGDAAKATERALELDDGEEATKEVGSIELNTRSVALQSGKRSGNKGPSLSSVDPSVANQKERASEASPEQRRNEFVSAIEMSTLGVATSNNIDRSEFLAALQTQQETQTRSQLSSAVSPEPTASAAGGSSFRGEASVGQSEGSRAGGCTAAPKDENESRAALIQQLSYHTSELQKIGRKLAEMD